MYNTHLERECTGSYSDNFCSSDIQLWQYINSCDELRNIKDNCCLNSTPRDTDLISLGWRPGIVVFFKLQSLARQLLYIGF